MSGFEELSRAFTTLFVIIDPIGNLPIFLALTSGMAAASQRLVIFWTILFTTSILIGVSLIGEVVLQALGISEGAFKIAGGIFLFWTAFEMMYERRQARKEKTARNTPTAQEIRALAASPLAIPLMAGPGTMTATIILTHEFSGAQERLELIGVIIAVCLISGLIYLAALPLSKLMSETVRLVITRILGLLLGALAVQIIVNGVRSLIGA